jgi:hypothetical protein
MSKPAHKLAWLRLNAYGVVLAGLALMAGLDLIDPANTDFGQLVGGVPPGHYLWTSGYVLGGLMMLHGFLRTDRLVETIGLSVLAVCQVLQIVVAIKLLGFIDFTWTRITVLTLVSLCSWARLSVLWSRDGLTITIPPRGTR